MQEKTQTRLTVTEILLARILDAANLLAWLNSQAGKDGTNRPESVLAALMGAESTEDKPLAFAGAAEYERARAEILAKMQ